MFLEVGFCFCFSLVFLGFLLVLDVFFVVVVEKEMKRRRWVGEKDSSGGDGKRGE